MQATLRLLPSAVALLALGSVGRAVAQTGSAGSPFLPPAGAMVSTVTGETLEFAGINVMGTKTLVNVYDKAAKKGRWIEVGGSDGVYSVLAYDARHEQIVVKSADGQKTLSLRKSTGPAHGPVPAPVAIMPAASGFATSPTFPNGTAPGAMPVAANAPAPADAPAAAPPATPPAPKSDAPAKPLTVARQEEEARMLVSDLLEIGMAQRKAYEEAQKKAAEGPSQPATTPAAPAPGG